MKCSPRLFYFLLILFIISSTPICAQQFKILVFSKTAGFRHSSIEPGIEAIRLLGTDNDFEVDATEDANLFTLENLQQYAAVVFLSTTGDILNTDQQAAFEAYIGQGGGYVGIHAASDTEYSWPWYGDLVGAYFKGHPAIQEATIEVADRVHPSTKFLQEYWVRNDEWYNYQSNPRGQVHILATLDESTYSGGDMGHDHPIAWCQEYEGGRAWYTGGGHTNESYSESEFMEHILGGIYYSAGYITGDFEATVEDKFEITVVDNDPVSPMAIAVLPNNSVLYIERAGRVKIKDAITGTIDVAGEFAVDAGREDGLIGVVLDPDFETNNWIYFFYSPQGSDDQHVSRFILNDGTLDMESEVIVLKIPVQRDECCHSGGDLEFDSQGNLYIGTGDNVNPFQSSGFAPIDERDGRAAFDAQATSANVSDLRGKILRIHPENDGTYSIPEGNLFNSADEGLPEIYVMGVRNPFRLALNPYSDELVWGDVGPDAANNSDSRGPRGYDEFNKTDVPGNFGWPYTSANNLAYNDYDFSNNAAGALFDPANLENDSPNNTGPLSIPPSIPAWIYYHNGNNSERPEFNASGGRSAIGGVYYEFKEENVAKMGFPEYYDNTLFVADWSRNWIKEIKIDEDGNLLQINPFLDNLELNSPIDLDFGPDGSLYIVEWGSGFTNNNPDARILKISFQSTESNRAPIAIASASLESGLAPLLVEFKGDESRDPDIGDALTYSWDFDDDGSIDASEANASFTYAENGVYNATLRVEDQDSLFSVAQIQIVVGNSRPELSIDFPPDGGFFSVFDTIEYSLTVSDSEDGDECDQNLPLGITVEPNIGHDDHAHGEGINSECLGEFVTSPHGDIADDLFYILNAKYEDRGGEVEFPLTAEASHFLQPKYKQAQYAQELFDLREENTGDFLGGEINMAYINHNSHLMYTPMNFENIDFMTIRWAALNHESTFEVHIDAPDGPIIASRSLPITGAWQTYDYFTMDLENPGGTHDVYLVFKNPGKTGLGNINFMEFHGKGVALNDPQAQKGLIATYYSNTDFTGESFSRKEPMIAWDWDDESPISSVGSDNFSVRWEGQILSTQSSTQTITAPNKNGTSRVVINGEELVNDVDGEGSFVFTAGELYDIVVEYVHNTGDAEIALRWEGIQPVNVIHTENLRTNTDPSSNIFDIEVNTENIAYPNPFLDHLQFTDKYIGETYKIYDAQGRLVKQGLVRSQINTKDLNQGVYQLKIKSAIQKIIKME